MLYITASYEKNYLFAKQKGKNIGRDGSAGRNACVRQAVVPARQPSKESLKSIDSNISFCEESPT
jgi:hypothetical protein